MFLSYNPPIRTIGFYSGNLIGVFLIKVLKRLVLVALTMIPSLVQAALAWPTAPTWQDYNVVPTTATICSVRIVSSSGNVTNAAGLLCNGGGGTSLQASTSGARPRIVLDYGHEVGGIPFFDVSSSAGSPQLKAGYGESARYLTDNGGDFAPVQAFGNGERDTSRADTYTIGGPGIIKNPATQGGERYQVITLTSPAA